MSEILIKVQTIQKIKVQDKWVEIWFQENDKGIERSYDLSCKTHVLIDKVSDISEEILNRGYAGLETIWIYIEPNWELFYAGRYKK